jgi:hypothetical protein
VAPKAKNIKKKYKKKNRRLIDFFLFCQSIG